MLDKLLKFITTARLPFLILEHSEFKDLVDVTQLAQLKIDLPSARTARRYLDTKVQERQRSVLEKLPDTSRLSIALDCSISPLSGIYGYYWLLP